MQADLLFANFLNGLSFGCILFLMATGLSITMGLMRIVNLAHGALYMVGAYIGVSAAKVTGSFLLGMLAGGLCAALLGLVMEAGFLRRLYKRELDQVLLTIGIVYILTNVTQWIWGPIPLSGITPSLLSGSLALGRVTIPHFRLSIIAFGLAAAAALWLLQEKTRVGAIVRAGMDNRNMTLVLGINIRAVFTGVFVSGAFLTGFCGLLGAPAFGVNLAIGWDALLLAMIVVIVGGVGSIQGAFLGGVMLGLIDAFGKAYFPDLAFFSIYLGLILILLIKPSGLMGRVI
ncbi:MAG: branched-chain amino acid ABC transporter permease [Thermodesulfobacteriota bacterium]